MKTGLRYLLLMLGVLIISTSCTENEYMNMVTPFDVTVTFDSQGGTNVASQTVKSGERVKMPQTPVKADGSQFEAWYADNETDVKFDFEIMAVSMDLTLYARWIPQYSVTYDYANGLPEYTFTVSEGTILDKPVNPSRKDYDFIGWYIGADEYAFTEPVTSDITITAKWEEVTPYATVTFYQNFGDETIYQEVQVIRYQTVSANQADNIAPNGCVALAWYTDKECTNMYDFSTIIAGPISLWGTWQMQDASGNLYGITKIGEQYWSTSNLKTRKFADGSNIPFAQAPNSYDTWNEAGIAKTAICSEPTIDPSWESNQTIYQERVERIGLLYNFFAASAPANICPDGWHVPDQEELKILKDSSWPLGNAIATNEEGAWELLQADWVSAPTESGSAIYNHQENNATGFNLYPNTTRLDNGWFVACNGVENNLDAKVEAVLWGSSANPEYKDWANNTVPAGTMGATFKLNAHEPWANAPDWRTQNSGFPVRCVRD